MSFGTIPIRGYGVTDPSWWNSLRTAGLALEGNQQNFALTNGQASPAAITGMAVDALNGLSARFDCEVRQLTSTSELVARGTVSLVYRQLTPTWDLLGAEWIGDDPGVTLSITTTGTVAQLSYVSLTLGGTGYVGWVKFKTIQMAV